MSTPSLRTTTSAAAACAAVAHSQEQPMRALKAFSIVASRSVGPSWRLQKGGLELLLDGVPNSGTHHSEDAAKIRRNMLDRTAFGLEHVGVEHGLPIGPFRRRQILDR